MPGRSLAYACPMTDPISPAGTVRVVILCIDPGMGEAFLKDVTGEEVTSPVTIRVGEQQVCLETLSGDPRRDLDWDTRVSGSDAMIMLARFLDVISLDKIKAIYRRLPGDSSVPFAVFIFREKKEADFKMSCPACGQKLWVRDADVGKRGRCPNCKKAFKLPSQGILMRSQLMLPDTVRVDMVDRGSQAQAQQALAGLVGDVTGELLTGTDGLDPENLKKTTVRVQIQSDQ